MGKSVNYSCRQLTEQKQMGSALKFSFLALSIPRQVSCSYAWWVCNILRLHQEGTSLVEILSISVNTHWVYQGDLIRVRCPERVWLLAYDISERPVHPWGWPNPKTNAEKVFLGKQYYYFGLEYASTHKVSLENIELEKLWEKLYKFWDIGKWWQL